MRVSSRYLLPALLASLLCVCCSPGDEQTPDVIDPNQASYDEVFDGFEERMQALSSTNDRGAFAGTFAVRSVSATLVETPAGERRGGGVNLRLLTRVYDEASNEYTSTSVLCGGENFEVSGVATNAPQSAYRAVPESTAEFARIDHERGVFLGGDHVQLWAIELGDALNEGFPADRDAALVDPRVFDADNDNNPGVTLFVSGIAQGEVYAVQRKKMSFVGIAQDADTITGFVTTTYDSVILGASNPLFEAADPSAASQHPEPNESWFEEKRVDDNTNCDEVVALDAADDFFAFKPAWVP